MSQSCKAFCLFMIATSCLLGARAWGQGNSLPSGTVQGAPTSSAGNADQFAAPAPVMTFLDMYTGQPWGRYVVSESVTVPKYEYQEVKEKVWVPTWVQEPKAATVTQYDPVVSYQLRPRSVPSSNPFAPPQQIVEYAPIVQYQPRNVQVNQMTAYQKYEEREVSRMVPVLVNASEQRAKFVDRPLTGSVAGSPQASNLVQESAMLSQANRTTARYPTRSIDYPSQPVYGSPVYGYTPSSLAWTTKTMVPPQAAMGSGSQYAMANGQGTIVPISNVAAMPSTQVPPNSGYYPASYAAGGSAPIVPINQPASPSMPASFAGNGTPIAAPGYSSGAYPQGAYPPGTMVPGSATASYSAPTNAPAYGVPPGYSQPGYGYSQPNFPPPNYAGATPTNPYAYAAGAYPPNPAIPNGAYPSNPNPAVNPSAYAANPNAVPPGYPPGVPPNPYGYNPGYNPYPPNAYASNPYGYGAPSSGQTMYNQYMAWMYSQGALFPSNMFSQRGGTASVATTGGYPYTGYPPGAYPSPNSMPPGYPPQAAQLANNNMGAPSNSPSYWGRPMPAVSNYKPAMTESNQADPASMGSSHSIEAGLDSRPPDLSAYPPSGPPGFQIR
jgi:hypothetical protein